MSTLPFHSMNVPFCLKKTEKFSGPSPLLLTAGGYCYERWNNGQQCFSDYRNESTIIEEGISLLLSRGKSAHDQLAKNQLQEALAVANASIKQDLSGRNYNQKKCYRSSCNAPESTGRKKLSFKDSGEISARSLCQ